MINDIFAKELSKISCWIPDTHIEEFKEKFHEVADMIQPPIMQDDFYHLEIDLTHPLTPKIQKWFKDNQPRN